ncbi:MAG: GNAT family N-acetyltransferase [Armatimonadota bacterium]|nr:GNAT family N-acetyltransferase [Armatimonadota bacterium]
MIYKLGKDKFDAVRSLFNQPQLGFVVDAVIAGNSNGDVWVDDSSCPRTACLWDRGPRYYMVGRDDNKAFNTELGRVIAEHPTSPYLVAYCASDAWGSKLSDVFAGRPFKKRQRCLYKLDRLAIPDWRGNITQGFSVERIDRQLLENEEIANLDGLKEEILCMWHSLDAFLEKAFGFCAIRVENSIACWCTAEYISRGQLGIGIETVREYQRQSLATLTASAFAEHCLSSNMDAHWDSWADNIPSIRVAEKVGFRKILDYYVYQGQ